MGGIKSICMELFVVFGIVAFVQGQGVSNYGHTIDQIEGLEITGMIAMFDTDCPIGWTRYTDLDGKFPRGDDVVNVGSEGGSDEYRISGQGTGADCCSGTLKFQSMEMEWRDGTKSKISAGSGMNRGAWAVHNPPYRNMVYCKKD